MAQLPFLVLLLVNHCIIQYVYYNDSSEMQQQIVVAVETQYQHQQWQNTWQVLPFCWSSM